MGRWARAAAAGCTLAHTWLVLLQCGGRRGEAPSRCQVRATRGRLQVVCASEAKFFVGGNWKANGTRNSVTALIKVR